MKEATIPHFLLAAALSLACSFLLMFLLARAEEPMEPRILGRQMPEFGMGMLTMPEATVSDWDFRGQLTLFNVFASWCADCADEQPILMEIAERGDIQVMGLNWMDNRADAIDWLKKIGDPYSRSAFDDDGDLAERLGVSSAPESFIVDQNGMIRYGHVGAITREVWAKTLEPIFMVVAQEELKRVD